MPDLNIPKPILVLDLGSNKIKGLLLTPDGTGVIEKRDASYIDKGVIDADTYISNVRSILKSLLEYSSSKEVFLGITGQRASMVGWDKDLDTLTPIYTWRDESSYIIYKSLKEREDLGLLEMFLQPGAGILRVKHILDNHSDISYVGGVESLVVYELFRESLTDYTFAYSYGIIEPFSISIIDDILNLLSIDREILPTFITVADLPLETRYNGFKLELMSVIADQSAALAGEGCFKKGCGKITMGTGFFIDYYTDIDFIGDVSLGINPMLAWIMDSKPRYMAEYFIYHGGDALDTIKNFGFNAYSLDIESFNFDLLPIFIPSYTFLTTEVKKKFEGALIDKIGLNISAIHIVQSIIASIAFLVYRGFRNLDHLGISGPLYASGGWSNNRILLQLISQFTGEKVIIRGQRTYSTLYGVIPFILRTAGIADESIIDHLRPVEDVINPLKEIDPSRYIARFEKVYEEIIR